MRGNRKTDVAVTWVVEDVSSDQKWRVPERVNACNDVGHQHAGRDKLVQSLCVSRIVISVNPLSPRFNTVIGRIMVTLTITGLAADTCPARLFVSVL